MTLERHVAVDEGIGGSEVHLQHGIEAGVSEQAEATLSPLEACQARVKADRLAQNRKVWDAMVEDNELGERITNLWTTRMQGDFID